MAYNERVKNFNRIRDYMREFYVYGFKSRDEFTKKSARSYDDEKRRLERARLIDQVDLNTLVLGFTLIAEHISLNKMKVKTSAMTTKIKDMRK